jgi:2-hydroxy-3-keto-5-methylthiopentenyl-1-phosphate phosphatase
VSEAIPLVLDWDGTVTEVDSLHMVLERFGDPAVYRAAEERLHRGLTLREVIGLELETITASLDEVVGWLLGNVRVRRGLADLVEHRDPLIVSAGFHELIEPVLAREGVRTRVVANTLRPDPSGWVAQFRSAPVCSVCGEHCKRDAVTDLGPFAFVGDGISDRCVALAASRVFARAGLAAWLDERAVPYEPFEDFLDLAARLEPSPRASA